MSGNIPHAGRDRAGIAGGFTSEWWARSSRNGGRVQPGISIFPSPTYVFYIRTVFSTALNHVCKLIDAFEIEERNGLIKN